MFFIAPWCHHPDGYDDSHDYGYQFSLAQIPQLLFFPRRCLFPTRFCSLLCPFELLLIDLMHREFATVAVCGPSQQNSPHHPPGCFPPVFQFPPEVYNEHLRIPDVTSISVILSNLNGNIPNRIESERRPRGTCNWAHHPSAGTLVLIPTPYTNIARIPRARLIFLALLAPNLRS